MPWPSRAGVYEGRMRRTRAQDRGPRADRAEAPVESRIAENGLLRGRRGGRVGRSSLLGLLRLLGGLLGRVAGGRGLGLLGAGAKSDENKRGESGGDRADHRELL